MKTFQLDTICGKLGPQCQEVFVYAVFPFDQVAAGKSVSNHWAFNVALVHQMGNALYNL